MSDSDLISRACETMEAYLALGNERFEACGATFVRNLQTPSRYDANTIGLIRDGSRVAELLKRADVEYAHLSYRQFHIDPLTPPGVEALLASAGYARWSAHLVMVLEGEAEGEQGPVDIHQSITEEDWHTYGQLQRLSELESEPEGDASDTSLKSEYLAYVRAKTSVVQTWLAYVDGTASAYASSWSDLNGIGLIEDLFTHPDYRQRGLATALIAHCTSNLRSRGAGPVLAAIYPSQALVRLFGRMGFRALFVARSQY